jgi:antitoxin component YwqK of YwqJK toxin-antitoxin module
MKPNPLFILGFILSLMACQNKNIEFTQNTSSHSDNSVMQTPTNDTIKKIRANFTRINSIQNWEEIESQELSQTTEGGEVKYYILDGQIQKMIVQKYGEMFQQTTEYYLDNNQLSFVFEKSILYNRPFNYGEQEMLENEDTEFFDLDKSKIIETRLYFENNKLIEALNSESEISKKDWDELEKISLNEFQNLWNMNMS